MKCAACEYEDEEKNILYSPILEKRDAIKKYGKFKPLWINVSVSPENEMKVENLHICPRCGTVRFEEK